MCTEFCPQLKMSINNIKSIELGFSITFHSLRQFGILNSDININIGLLFIFRPFHIQNKVHISCLFFSLNFFPFFSFSFHSFLLSFFSFHFFLLFLPFFCSHSIHFCSHFFHSFFCIHFFAFFAFLFLHFLHSFFCSHFFHLISLTFDFDCD